MTSWLSWPVLAAWAVLALACAAWTIRDLRHNNAFLGGIMKVAWVLTVLYSGPLGLLVYVYSGRGQIRRDSLWRRSFRSVYGSPVVGSIKSCNLLVRPEHAFVG